MLARGEMVRFVFFTFQLVLCHLAGKTGSLNPLNMSYLMLSLKITPCIHQVNATHLAAAVHDGGLTWVEHMSFCRFHDYHQWEKTFDDTSSQDKQRLKSEFDYNRKSLIDDQFQKRC